jgi:chromosome segregation ATPase
VIRDREAEAERLEQRQAEIGQEQARLRENIGAVPKDSDLFQRYLAKLNDSESELEQVGTGLDKLRKAIDAARAQFRQSVRKLNV